MINLASERSNNQKLNVKLLVNNPDKVSEGDREQIEKWAQESQVPIVKLATPLNGDPDPSFILSGNPINQNS